MRPLDRRAALGLALATLTGAAAMADIPAPPPIEGATWRAEAIGGNAPPAGAEVTLEIAGGNASGSAGCNRYTGAARLAGNGLSLGPLAATRMACAEPLMAVEQAFLDALARTTRYDAAGALRLYAGEDEVAVLRR
jgi:heat shock protein HslJ